MSSQSPTHESQPANLERLAARGVKILKADAASYEQIYRQSRSPDDALAKLSAHSSFSKAAYLTYLRLEHGLSFDALAVQGKVAPDSVRSLVNIHMTRLADHLHPSGNSGITRRMLIDEIKNYEKRKILKNWSQEVEAWLADPKKPCVHGRTNIEINDLKYISFIDARLRRMIDRRVLNAFNERVPLAISVTIDEGRLEAHIYANQTTGEGKRLRVGCFLLGMVDSNGNARMFPQHEKSAKYKLNLVDCSGEAGEFTRALLGVCAVDLDQAFGARSFSGGNEGTQFINLVSDCTKERPPQITFSAFLKSAGYTSVSLPLSASVRDYFVKHGDLVGAVHTVVAHRSLLSGYPDSDTWSARPPEKLDPTTPDCVIGHISTLKCSRRVIHCRVKEVGFVETLEYFGRRITIGRELKDYMSKRTDDAPLLSPIHVVHGKPEEKRVPRVALADAELHLPIWFKDSTIEPGWLTYKARRVIGFWKVGEEKSIANAVKIYRYFKAEDRFIAIK